MIIQNSESTANGTAEPQANSLVRACVVTIVIKALNEEKRIEAAIESSLAALAGVGGEVVLADSCSTDRTVELASRYPIRIVQLAHSSERCCGIGPQLGYQHSFGKFVYILDGDMLMLEGFLPKAVAYLLANPEFAGVAGQVVEMNTHSLEYVARMERASGHMQSGEVDRLDMGGLYRRTAVDEVGYFSDRNLHSYEELDLAVRLRAKGWRLFRLEDAAVRHHGHDAPPYALLRRRWISRYACGLGELVRSSWGSPRLALVTQGARELKIYLAVWCWWLMLIAVLVFPMGASFKAAWFVALFFAPFVAMAVRKRSLRKSIFSVVSWGVNAAGLLRGLLTPRKSPEKEIASVVVRDAV